MTRLAGSSAACGVLLATVVAGQILRTRTDLVEVDVAVTDRRGRPVTDLQASDFEVHEDGALMRIEAFDAIHVAARSSATPIVRADGSGAAVASNETPADGRLIVLVLDDVGAQSSMARTARIKRLGTALIERLGPADQVAVLATSGRPRHQAEFTADRKRLLATLDGLGPLEAMGADEEQAVGLRSFYLLDILTSLAKSLGDLPHRRKAIALLSEGVSTPIGGYDTRGYASEMATRFQQMVGAAHRANVAIYTFDVGDVDSGPGQIRAPSSTRQDSLRSFADATGGRSVIQNAGHRPALDRMVAETGSYYLLAYASPAPPDGRFRRISVRVKRQGVEVRARPGYHAVASNAEKAALPPIERLVTLNIPTGGLPLRIAAVPVPSGQGKEWPVAISLEALATPMAGATTIEGLIVAVDHDGTIVARDAFELKLEPQPDAGPARWLRIASRLALAPGRYHLRAALRRADGGAEGSVFTTVDVPAPQDGMQAGALTLATLPAGVARAQRLSDLLPVVPMAARDVPAAQTMLGALGLRLPAGSTGDVTFSVTLRGGHGTAVLETTTRPASAFAPGGSGYVFRIIVKGLDPGPYTVGVDVTHSGRTLSRSLPFSVRP